MKNKLNKIIKNMSGNVLIVGFKEESKIIEEIDKNKKILSLTHLSNDLKKEKNKKRKLFGKKQISIKKMYKDLKKEKFDYILVELKVVKKYLDSFIYNSSKLTNNEIYFVLDDELYDYKELMYRYKRYKADTNYEEFKEEYIVTINLSNIKLNIFKRIIYRIRDIIYDILELIASIIIA